MRPDPANCSLPLKYCSNIGIVTNNNLFKVIFLCDVSIHITTFYLGPSLQKSTNISCTFNEKISPCEFYIFVYLLKYIFLNPGF